MCNGGVNRPGVFRGAAASGRELHIDLAYRHTIASASSSNFRSAASGVANR
jgi:hypothetical protein